MYAWIFLAEKGSKIIIFPIEIQYTFGLDAETTARSFKRVFLLENGKKVYEKTARFNLTDKNDTKCLNFSQVRVEVCTHIV
jgi:hypothetical protein